MKKQKILGDANLQIILLQVQTFFLREKEMN